MAVQQCAGTQGEGQNQTVLRSSDTVQLTTAEFDLLQVLLRNARTVVPREELARIAFGRALCPVDRTIDLHVSHLRRKLGQYPGGSSRVKAIRGLGYLYALPARGHALEVFQINR